MRQKEMSLNEGFVELAMLRALGLENIQLVLVPVQTAYEDYLNGARSRSSFLKAILVTL